MSRAWVGLGSNLGSDLGNSAAHIQAALSALDGLPDTSCLRASRLYRSAPIGPQDQDDFCNAVAELETQIPATALLKQLLEIEQEHQRKRTRRWGPRSLDLDLLLYGDLMLNTAFLKLPHPRMHERAFVLVPMAELEPTLEIPQRGAVSHLLRALSEQQIALWDSP